MFCLVSLFNDCTATYLPFHKSSKEEEQDMIGNAGEARTISDVTFSYQLLLMDTLVLIDLQTNCMQTLCEDTGCRLDKIIKSDGRSRWICHFALMMMFMIYNDIQKYQPLTVSVFSILFCWIVVFFLVSDKTLLMGLYGYIFWESSLNSVKFSYE